MKRTGIYLQVSQDSQTTENQRRILMEVAERSGWTVVEVFEDAGFPGAKGRDKRPAFDALLKAVHRREIDMVAAFAVDRLGRSLPDLVSFLNDIQASACDLYLHQQAVDTSTPSGPMLFQMLAVFSEFERAIITSRINASLARARARGLTFGRPNLSLKVRAPEGPKSVGGRSLDPSGRQDDRRLLGLGRPHQTLHGNGQGRPSGERRCLTSEPVVAMI